MIILDTNVLSELIRDEPDRRVRAWVDAQPEESVFTTTVTMSEILTGVALLPRGRRRDELSAFADWLFGDAFAGRILAFDEESARQLATRWSSARGRGESVSQADAQIAAIAATREAAVATRDTGPFLAMGVSVLDPWGT